MDGTILSATSSHKCKPVLAISGDLNLAIFLVRYWWLLLWCRLPYNVNSMSPERPKKIKPTTLSLRSYIASRKRTTVFTGQCRWGREKTDLVFKGGAINTNSKGHEVFIWKVTCHASCLEFGKNLGPEYTGVWLPVFEWQRGDRATGDKDSIMNGKLGIDTAVTRDKALVPVQGTFWREVNESV